MQLRLKSITETENEERIIKSITLVNDDDENISYTLTVKGNITDVDNIMKALNLLEVGEEITFSMGRNTQTRIGDKNE
jgi:hypothetical protein